MPNSTEARIRDVATELFYERGYHAATMREIAAAVGIKAGSLYNHYPGKQDILYRICFDTAEALQLGAVQRLAKVKGTEMRLRELLTWHVEFHATNRLAARVADEQLNALTPDNRERVVAIRDAYEDQLLGLLKQGKRQRIWSIADVQVIAYGIGMMCTGVDAWFRPEGKRGARQIGEIYADFILRGLQPTTLERTPT